ncbi:protein diaphanous homolog 1 [Folsomia candida]|uniref:protein diaphanous homolog 1 n=1 Tax=Folsomia candida TaxID=158441 RepID=UPI000B901970|nr:protein diaphanous homolog 1 [Folsomia candida]
MKPCQIVSVAILVTFAVILSHVLVEGAPQSVPGLSSIPGVSSIPGASSIPGPSSIPGMSSIPGAGAVPTDPTQGIKTGANMLNTGKNMIPGASSIPNVPTTNPIPIPGKR